MRHLHQIGSVLIVGFGSIGKRHARIIQELYPGIRIILLRHNKCDGKDVAPYDCVTSIQDALALNPSVAIVANPATKHLNVAMQLADASVHLLIEKPISAESAGVKELISLCKKKNIVLMTAYSMRFAPSLIKFCRQVQAEKVGNILSVQVRVGQNLLNWRPGSDYRKTVSAKKELGGGVLLELSHEIDYLLWIFGPIIWVKSHLSKQSNLEIDVEDTANIILGIKNPIGPELVIMLSMDFIRHDSTRNCAVIGDKGTLEWDWINGKVKFFKKDGDRWDTIFSSKPHRDYVYSKEIKHFFDSVELGRKPSITGEDGLSTMHVVEAIRRSSKSGSIVYL